ncbi:hypothetical protein Sjap_013641 [Stephania japonica]|uniref:Tyrosine specific protein phosphatases domain-containing protein n=1 Tax=Stephania japonica TaxID=461633 RepID=A0AAP0IY95_9MAGN
MNCLQNLPRSFRALPLEGGSAKDHGRRKPSTFPNLSFRSTATPTFVIQIKASAGRSSGTEMSDAKVDEEKSEVYSSNMTQAMGAVLTYRHELGMNYNYIRPDLIVGSCLQLILVRYFGVDIIAIQEYAKQYSDIEHIRAEIRDFDAFDLRLRLPAVVSKLYQAIKRNGGVTYIHCTAGLGRAPAVTSISNATMDWGENGCHPGCIDIQHKKRLSKATMDCESVADVLAYMFWVQGYKLMEAHSLLLKKRPCFPKLDAIRSATADILTGLTKNLVTLIWDKGSCSSVEVSGLDIGWGQRIPMKFDEEESIWILQKELPEGHYEYKYVVDGVWTINKRELETAPNKDGHINNYVDVFRNDTDSDTQELRERLGKGDADLTLDERCRIKEFLEAQPDD